MFSFIIISYRSFDDKLIMLSYCSHPW